VVMRPFIFGATNGQEGEPPRRKRTTAPRLCTPSALLKSAVQHGGPGPHVMQPVRRLLGAEKSHRRLRQCRVPSGPHRRLKKFSEPVQRLEAPRAWPNSDIKYKGHGPVSRGNGCGSRRRAGSNCINRRTGTGGNRQSDSGPTCRLAPSPEVGLGATVSTLNQGYPLLQNKDTAWRTVP
jgi:hypothetical protein